MISDYALVASNAPPTDPGFRSEGEARARRKPSAVNAMGCISEPSDEHGVR